MPLGAEGREDMLLGDEDSIQIIQGTSLFSLCFVLLRLGPRVLHLPGKCSPPEFHPQALVEFVKMQVCQLHLSQLKPNLKEAA